MGWGTVIQPATFSNPTLALSDRDANRWEAPLDLGTSPIARLRAY